MLTNTAQKFYLTKIKINERNTINIQHVQQHLRKGSDYISRLKKKKNKLIKKKNLDSGNKNINFDIRRNKKYCIQLKTLFTLSKTLKIPITRHDFQFFFYYKKLMTKKIIPLKWPIYKLPWTMPKEYLLKTYYLQRKRWKILFYNKIRLIRIYHWSCVKWYMKKFYYNSVMYKRAFMILTSRLAQIKVRYLKKKKIKPIDQKKEYLNQKFNKKFKLFKNNIKYKKYAQYKYQLKLLQNQFILHLQITPYFYKQLAFYYKQCNFCSNYEKFFYILWHRIVVILHKLRYFSSYYITISIYYKVLKSGLILVNGRIIRNPYSCVWLNDTISVAYKLYCFEWIIYRQYILLKKRLWIATQKAFIKKTLYKPYILKNIGKFIIYRKPWVYSSRRVPSSIVINGLGKFWRKKLFPRFYNYLNLQIISELLTYQHY